VIPLKHRLTATYVLFIGLALGALTLLVNQITLGIFTGLIKQNIMQKSDNIVWIISEQYDPERKTFDKVTIEAIGMYFIHEGYILTIFDERGEVVWDARSHDMKECAAVLDTIAARMEKDFRVSGSFQKRRYPLGHADAPAGTISIETYGPFFYSEAEALFLSSVNRLFAIAGLVLILLSWVISINLSRAIARPILKAAEAARQIAALHGPGSRGRQNPAISLPEHYRTTELAGLSRSINDLARELEEGERRQQQLIADLAHELRTPLTSVRGSIEAILDGVWLPDREHLSGCHEEIMRVIRLIEDLGTLTNLEWEQIGLNKTDFDLAELLRLTADQNRAAAEKKGLAITLNLVPSPINADYDRLKQVFCNLLANALHYTDQGGIWISLEPLPHAGNAAQSRRVSIGDTGIGIAPEDLPHIFERLYRADKSRSRNTGGAGIGLAIAAAIVSAHGGAIRAESGAVGTVFQVDL
jgi:signal transduction histidine kinase